MTVAGGRPPSPEGAARSRPSRGRAAAGSGWRIACGPRAPRSSSWRRPILVERGRRRRVPRRRDARRRSPRSLARRGARWRSSGRRCCWAPRSLAQRCREPARGRPARRTSRRTCSALGPAFTGRRAERRAGCGRRRRARRASTPTSTLVPAGPGARGRRARSSSSSSVLVARPADGARPRCSPARSSCCCSAFIGGRTRAITERRFAELRWLGRVLPRHARAGIATLKMFGRSARAGRQHPRRSAGSTATRRWRCCGPRSRRRSSSSGAPRSRSRSSRSRSACASWPARSRSTGRSPSSSSSPSSSCRSASWRCATTPGAAGRAVAAAGRSRSSTSPLPACRRPVAGRRGRQQSARGRRHPVRRRDRDATRVAPNPALREPGPRRSRRGRDRRPRRCRPAPGKSTIANLLLRFIEPDARRDPGRRPTGSRRSTAAAWRRACRLGPAAAAPVPRHGRRQHPPRPARRDDEAVRAAAREAGADGVHRGAARTATTTPRRRGRRPAERRPAPADRDRPGVPRATRRSSSSTRRRRTSTPTARRRSASRSAGCAGGGRCSSSRTGSGSSRSPTWSSSLDGGRVVEVGPPAELAAARRRLSTAARGRASTRRRRVTTFRRLLGLMAGHRRWIAVGALLGFLAIGSNVGAHGDLGVPHLEGGARHATSPRSRSRSPPSGSWPSRARRSATSSAT